MKRFVKCFFELLTQNFSARRETGRKRGAKRACGRLQALLRNTPFCSLGEVGGARAEPPQNLTTTAAVVQTVLPLEWSRRKRGQDFFILFPVFGGEMTTAKIQTVKGLRVEIFSRSLRKNTTRPLTVWIVGTA